MIKKTAGWVLFGIGVASIAYFVIAFSFGYVPAGGLVFLIVSAFPIYRGWKMSHPKLKPVIEANK